MSAFVKSGAVFRTRIPISGLLVESVERKALLPPKPRCFSIPFAARVHSTEATGPDSICNSRLCSWHCKLDYLKRGQAAGASTATVVAPDYSYSYSITYPDSELCYRIIHLENIPQSNVGNQRGLFIPLVKPYIRQGSLQAIGQKHGPYQSLIAPALSLWAFEETLGPAAGSRGFPRASPTGSRVSHRTPAAGLGSQASAEDAVESST